MQNDGFELWTVCAHPSDYPDHFTARKSVICPDGATVMTGDVTLADTLEEIRDAMELRGLCRIVRDLEDDAVIVEVWL
jgi:hypothetical protein